MIGVMVGIQYAVDLSNIVLETLLPEVRGGVDQNIESVVLDQNGSPEALVVWIVRLADIAGTA
jgi:hypothetical protein